MVLVYLMKNSYLSDSITLRTWIRNKANDCWKRECSDPSTCILYVLYCALSGGAHKGACWREGGYSARPTKVMSPLTVSLCSLILYSPFMLRSEACAILKWAFLERVSNADSGNFLKENESAGYKTVFCRTVSVYARSVHYHRTTVFLFFFFWHAG